MGLFYVDKLDEKILLSELIRLLRRLNVMINMFLLVIIDELKYNSIDNSPKETTLNIENLMSDKAVLEEVGHRLSRCRVEQEVTQAKLAKEAGLSKRTVERIEAGESTQTSSLVRIMRVLGLLESLDAAMPETGPRPMDLLKLRGKERQRASSKKNKEQVGKEWSWGDET